jgi:FkbM family methyltransferase
MKQLIKSILTKLGWQLIRQKDIPSPTYGLNSFFTLLKSLGFSPKHIIDVGANYGNWTRTAVKFFPEASYTLVEPQANLRENIQDLIAQGYKINWINAGAGDTQGNLMFTIAQRDDSSSFVPTAQEALAANRPQISVPVRTLREIVASSGLPVPEMIKIDAEGFDLKVLAGASDLFEKTEIFLVEALVCAPSYDNTIMEMINRMGKVGYKLMDITDLNRSPKHGLLWLCELAFVKNDSLLLKDRVFYE